MKRSSVWKPGVVVFALTCAFAAFAQPSQAEPIPLRVQIFPGAYSSITVHVADELGFYEKNGLKVETVPAQSSSAAIAAMLGGSIDIVESGADLVLSNIDKGVGIKYLMANETKNYATLVVSDKVATPHAGDGYPAIMQDLKGLRFGVNAIGSTLHLAAVLMLKEAGMTDQDVQFVATGTGANTVAAWQAGTVDVQMTFAPVPELIEALGLGHTVLVLANEGPEVLKFQNLYSGWVATQEFTETHKAAADAFIAAMKESIDWIKDPSNNARLLEFAKEYSPVKVLPQGNDEVLAKMIENYRQYWGYQISPQTVALWNKYVMSNGLTKKELPFEAVVYAGAPSCTTDCK